MASPRKRACVVAAAVGLIVLTLAVYHPVRHHEFLPFDDQTFLVENTHLESGLTADGLGWALGSSYDGSWIPVTWLSFLMDQEVHGLSAPGVHLVNVLLHALSAVLLMLALARMTGAFWPAVFVAAVFAIHPLHVESVAWAIERKDVLAGFFFSATLLAWARYADRESLGRYSWVVFFFALGLLAKPMLVTLPLVLLLLDGWPLGRLASAEGRRRSVLEKLPLLGLAGAISVVTLQSQRVLGAMDPGESFSFGTRLGNALLSYAVYLRKAFWPSDLAIFYPHLGSELSLLQVASGALLVLGVTVCCLRLVRSRPYLAVGWFWYLGMLVPVIGLVQVGGQSMADRYTYLPLVGVTLALAWAAHAVFLANPRLRAPVAGTGILVVAVLAIFASFQVRVWRDGASVFEHALAVTEDNEVAHNGLAGVLLGAGDPDEALKHLERAIAIQPDFTDAHVNLGAALVARGEPRMALPHLERGLALPDYRLPRVHAHLGLAYQRLGEPAPALQHYRAALKAPDVEGVTHVNMAIVLMELGHMGQAELALARAERLGNESAEQYATQATIRQARGDAQGAAERYRRALALRPDWPLVQNNLAWLLATDAGVRDAGEAVRLAESAARAGDGEEPQVLDTLSAAYAAAARWDDAVSTAERALDLARKNGNAALAADIEGRVDTYRRRGRPPGFDGE